MLKAAVVGAAGYVGGELLRLLLDHPAIAVTQATSERLAGRPLHHAHPPLRGASELRFRRRDDLAPADLLLLCLPHGEAALAMDTFATVAPTVVDTSADFRLRDPAIHRRWYGETGAVSPWRGRFVYGLPELGRERLRGARWVSGPGCNATAMALALAPLVAEGLVERAVADVKVGSSEGGARSSPASHHPERAGALRTFAPVRHRHQAEVCQETGLDPGRLEVTATATAAVRGVLATLHVSLARPVAEGALGRLFRDAYAGEPFVRLVRERQGLHRYPDPKVLAGSNFCDLGWELGDGDRLVVLAALDNLVKGAAGSAIQSLNVALGLPERAGLGFRGLHPL